MHDSVLSNSIHVLGAPRSGTTILSSRILSHHRDLAYIGEPRLTWRFGNDKKSDMLRDTDARPQVIRHIRNAFSQQLDAQRKHRLLENGPDNSLRIPFMVAVMPSPMFIHVIRDGVDSVLSIRSHWQKSAGSLRTVRWRKRLREMHWRQVPHYTGEVLRRCIPKRIRRKRSLGWTWGPMIPGLRQMRGELDLTEICCLQWRMCVETACHVGRRLGPARYLELRLGEIGHDTLDRILAFTGLSDDPSMRKAFDEQFKPDRALVGSRSNAAEPDEVRRILDWIEPTMDWLGQDTSRLKVDLRQYR